MGGGAEHTEEFPDFQGISGKNGWGRGSYLTISSPFMRIQWPGKVET